MGTSSARSWFASCCYHNGSKSLSKSHSSNFTVYPPSKASRLKPVQRLKGLIQMQLNVSRDPNFYLDPPWLMFLVNLSSSLPSTIKP